VGVVLHKKTIYLKRLFTGNFWCALLAGGLIAGCNLHPVSEAVDPTVPGGEAFTISPDGVEVPNRWWESLGDKKLSALVEKALSNNLDLQQARVRIEQAESIQRQASADLFPQIDAGGAARHRWPDVGHDTDTLTGALAISWEADLWGRLTSTRQAAEFNTAASREDLQATALLLAGEVAETYLGVVEQKLQLTLLTRQIEVSKTLLSLIELRFSVGESDIVDVYQQRQQLASTESQLPLIHARRRVLANRLKVLVARSPADSPEPASDDLPKLTALPKVGLPSSLLTNRPDLRRIRCQLIAADHRVGQAIADRLPRLVLGLERGYDGTEFRRLTAEGLFTSLAGDLAGPVVDFGRRKAEVQRRRAIVKEHLLEFSKTYLIAIGEVEDALWRERRQQELIVALDKELEIATRNLKETQIRFSRAALTDYLPVLAAIQSLQALERNLLTRRRELVSIRILLYRALGGSGLVQQDASKQNPAFGRKN
jgi:NodT family efflux transporter outer membrane factor (OMF) lipoprotein